MSEETAAASAAPAAATPKKSKAKAVKKPKTAPSHPKVSDMVNNAITSLKERGGSSLQAIKKHIGSNNKVDMDRLTPFVRKYLKSAVASGSLVQTKGKGANGSFKLSASGQKKDVSVKVTKKAGSPAKKAKAATTKKTAKPKKAASEKKKSPAKKPKPSSPKKSPKKAAKPAKPKAPKVKKMKTPKKAAGPKKSAKK